MEQNNDFMKDVRSIQKNLQEANARLQIVQFLYEKDMEELYSEIIRLQLALEKATLRGRGLPFYTGRVRAREDLEKLIKEAIPSEIGFTKEGWFSVRMPLLLPKKGIGSVDYIRGFLYPAMEDFFRGKERVRYKDCVVAYRNVYGEEYPKSWWRDHDNIETNQVTDIIALFVMPDDNPIVCDHYYTSAVGKKNRTEIYIVPRKDFIQWLEQEKSMPKEGVKLFETLQQR